MQVQLQSYAENKVFHLHVAFYDHDISFCVFAIQNTALSTLS